MKQSTFLTYILLLVSTVNSKQLLYSSEDKPPKTTLTTSQATHILGNTARLDADEATQLTTLAKDVDIATNQNSLGAKNSARLRDDMTAVAAHMHARVQREQQVNTLLKAIEANEAANAKILPNVVANANVAAQKLGLPAVQLPSEATSTLTTRPRAAPADAAAATTATMTTTPTPAATPPTTTKDAIAQQPTGAGESQVAVVEPSSLKPLDRIDAVSKTLGVFKAAHVNRKLEQKLARTEAGATEPMSQKRLRILHEGVKEKIEGLLKERVAKLKEGDKLVLR